MLAAGPLSTHFLTASPSYRCTNNGPAANDPTAAVASQIHPEKKGMRAMIRSLWCTPIALLFTSCGDGGDGVRKLSEGVNLVRLSGNSRAIVDQEGNFLVYPSVTLDYVVRDGFVIGKREKPASNVFDTPEFTSGHGYFYLDLATHKLVEGLSASECAADDICSDIM